MARKTKSAVLEAHGPALVAEVAVHGDAQRCRARADAILLYFLQAYELYGCVLGYFAELAACKALADSSPALPTQIIAALCVHTW